LKIYLDDFAPLEEERSGAGGGGLLFRLVTSFSNPYKPLHVSRINLHASNIRNIRSPEARNEYQYAGNAENPRP
jgi:hypothetical protein